MNLKNKIIPLCVGVFCLSCVVGVTIFAWSEPGGTPPESNVAAPLNAGATDQTKAGKLNVSRDNVAECCSSGNYTMSLSESTKNADGTTNTGNRATLQFHNAYEAEGYFQLNAGSVGSGYELKAGSYQADMALHATGMVRADKGFCIGAECCDSWAECLSLGYSEDPGSQPAGTPFTQPSSAPCNSDLTAKNLRVFVTSSAYTGSQVASVANADNLCAGVASAYGLPGTYKALMYYSDGTTRNPMSVLASDARYWNGGRASESDPVCAWSLVADNPNDFFTTSGGNYLDNPIQYNEKGLAANFTVWSNYSATGSGNWDGYAGSGGSNGCTGVCNYGCGSGCSRYGSSSSKSAGWTGVATTNYGSCGSCMNQSRAIYCVQQRAAKDDIAGPCSVALPGNNKKIFVTSKSYTGYQVANVGLADAICQSHADNAKMTGTYKAFMYYGDGTTRNPYNVLATGASFWNCGTDGDPVTGTYNWKPIASSPSEFFSTDGSGNYLENPIKYDEMGKPTDSSVTVWTNFAATGSGNWDGYAGSSGSNGCTGVCNYGCGSGCSRYGGSFSVGTTWASTNTNYGSCGNCMNQSRAIYCVEQ